MRAGQRAERDRRVGHAERRGTDRLDRDAALVGDDRQSVDVAGLALIRAHAGGGVALDVLDRLESLANREPQVLGRHVVLEIDEGLHTAGGDMARHSPSRQKRCLHRLANRRPVRLGCGKARPAGCFRASTRTLGEAIGKGEAAVGGAGRLLGLERLLGHESGDGRIEAELAARLREQVHGRIPAARDQETVAAQGHRLARHAAAIGLHGRHPGAADPKATIGADYGSTAPNRQAGRCCRGR
jgi:hypothetical protein